MLTVDLAAPKVLMKRKHVLKDARKHAVLKPKQSAVVPVKAHIHMLKRKRSPALKAVKKHAALKLKQNAVALKASVVQNLKRKPALKVAQRRVAKKSLYLLQKLPQLSHQLH
ncbi:MAG: hypothetical protein ACSHYA_12290 [Opitutaceae bacterium]